MTPSIKIGNKVFIGNGEPLALIGGPCVIESREHCKKMAVEISKICSEAEIGYIFKASFDKANRSSIDSYRGPGLDASIDTFNEIRDLTNVPVTTDIHESWQAERIGRAVDLIQIPAFLCRQTDLLTAAAKTNKPVSVKKGQFMSAYEMENVVRKIQRNENQDVILIERGNSFGYNNLIVDLRNIVIMRQFAPVVFDATHSVQIPGGLKTKSGGDNKYIKYLARAAVSTGVDGIFLEIHDNPEEALCDGPNMIRLDELPSLLEELCKIDSIVRE